MRKKESGVRTKVNTKCTYGAMVCNCMWTGPRVNNDLSHPSDYILIRQTHFFRSLIVICEGIAQNHWIICVYWEIYTVFHEPKMYEHKQISMYLIIFLVSFRLYLQVQQGVFNMSHVMRKSVYAICQQQRRRSACASAQSDQRICYSLLRQYNTSSFYSRNFNTLASLISWAGRFESYLVANPEDRVSCDEAHIIIFTGVLF